MDKSILMSIKPQWLCKILNGEKTIEIRKKFPKDYVGWVYIYCTKKCNITQDNNGQYVTEDKNCRINPRFSIHGKVVARFWCDKVEEIECVSVGDSDYGSLCSDTEYCTETLSEKELTQKSCLIPDEIFEYLDEDFDKIGYAINISKLEVFEKPKELEEFGYRSCNFEKCYRCEHYNNGKVECGTIWNTITKAPQSWCYIEGE